MGRLCNAEIPFAALAAVQLASRSAHKEYTRETESYSKLMKK
jgi:hypothetical protein